MSKIITFSTRFPAYHPKVGEPTNFVEKIWESLIQLEEISISRCCELSRETGIGNYTMNSIRKINFEPKFHTIRAGHRFKVGDWFSPRIWSGKSYHSKQIIIAPDIQVKKVWDFEFIHGSVISDNDVMTVVNGSIISILGLSENDGLTEEDFMYWFNKDFNGQIICWNESIEY